MYDELVERLRSGSYTLEELSIILPKAADAIEELSHENESLAKSVNEASEILRKRWISVTERLPENIDEEVLVCNEEYGKSGLGIVTVAIYDGGDWIECWLRKANLVGITHWMPLPEPPKEETK